MLVNIDTFADAVKAITTDFVVVDIETEGLNLWWEDRLCGIGICTSKEETFYFPYRHKDVDMPTMVFLSDYLPNINLPIETLSILFEKLSQVNTLIGHNIKFDLTGLLKDGFNDLDEVSMRYLLSLTERELTNETY